MFEVENLIRKHKEHIVDGADYYEEVTVFQKKIDKKKQEELAHGGHGSPEIPFVPLHLWKEANAILVFTAIFLAVVILLPHHEMGEKKANPLSTPAEIMPPWYFQPVFGLLRVSTAQNELLNMALKTFAVLAPVIVIALLLVVPWLDRNPEVKLSRRPLAFWGSIVVMISLALFGIKGFDPEALKWLFFGH